MTTTGVIVGRFQTYRLTEAHRKLIKYVMCENRNVIIFIGVSSFDDKPTFYNPLTFNMRKEMIVDFINTIPINNDTIEILPIKDVGNVDLWSKKLDEEIEEISINNTNVVLYGGRDSFNYTGKYPKQTVKIEINSDVSSTKMRTDVIENTNTFDVGEEFKKGIIWSLGNQFPTVLSTVDIGIINPIKHQLLLAKKSTDKLYRFIGGFSDVNDDSFEESAIREVKEETGLTIKNVEYIGSYKIDDWRFKKEQNKIKTLFFKAYYTDKKEPKANDDICEVKWFNIFDIKETDIVEFHRPLLKMIF